MRIKSWSTEIFVLKLTRHLGRVVKAADSKSAGHCPREFKPHRCRFFILHKPKTEDKKNFLFSKETSILLNNWFMMYFLSVVLIGTVYPIFLEVIENEKISVGPPFYNQLIIPILVPFLFLMSIGANLKWIRHSFKLINIKLILLFILSIFISFLILIKPELNSLFTGAEGTLGITSKIIVNLSENPDTTKTFLLTFMINNYDYD